MNIFPLKNSRASGQLLIIGADAAMDGGETVSQMVAAHPGRARVFEKWGMAYCCGHHTLEQACREQGIDAEAIRADLRACDESTNQIVPSEGVACSEDSLEKSLAEQIDFIVRVPHQHLREEMPRLARLIDRVAGDHGAAFSEFWEMQGLFEDFREQVEAHILHEETALFPLLLWLESPAPSRPDYENVSSGSAGNSPDDLLSLTRLICQQQSENIMLHASLKKLIAWTRDFQPPVKVCTTYCVLVHDLGTLESVLLRHLSAEEDSLFARALALIGPSS